MPKTSKQGVAEYTRQALHTYGSYVVSERALSDARDGLKPVQRRILWTMHQLKATSDKAHKKSAKIVGATMGDYHPHGDTAIYDSLVAMTHAHMSPVAGHGNWGGHLFNAAAQRYTESKLSPFGESCLENMEVMAMVPNYSSSAEEPLVLPVKVPMLLVNGSSGIGLGISASIPSHNLGEVIAATRALLKDPDMTLQEICTHIKGPDQSTGVMLSSHQDVLDLYRTGKGTLQYRCKWHWERSKDLTVLAITEVCSGFSFQSFFAKMQKLAEEGLIEYCSDQTSSEGLRALVAVKDASILEERVLPLLYTKESYQFHTVIRKEETVLDDTTLKRLNLKELIQTWITFRMDVEDKRIKSELRDLNKLHSKAWAMLAACQNLPAVMKVLTSKFASRAVAVSALSVLLELSEEQASHVLSSPVWSLSKLNLENQQLVVSSIEQRIIDTQDLLCKLPSVLDKTLASMLPFSKPRGTAIRVKAPKTPGAGGDIVMMARRGGYLKRATDVDTRSRFYYDWVLKCVGWACVADGATAQVHRRQLSYFSEDDTKMQVVGLVDSRDEFLAALDVRGKGIIIVNQKATTFSPIKDAKKLVSVCGLGEDDKLILLDDRGNGKLINDWQAGTRSSKGKSLGRMPGKAVAVVRFPKNAKLWDHKGPIAVRGTWKWDQELWVVGAQNYVQLTDGKRKVLSRRLLLSALEQKTVRHTQPL